MGLFDKGVGLGTIGSLASSLGSNAASAVGSLGSVAGTVSRVAGALNNLSNPAALVSSLRSINLPVGGAGGSKGIFSAGAQFVGTDANKDWRVRLSLPTTPTYLGSPILQPLVRAGGLVWPYTPTVSISHNATYDETPITHQNYSFISYQGSRQQSIQINGAFNVEDAVQAQYWVAAVHFLRSITKMFAGDMGAEAGNPPPLVFLNGYGDYVFKNIPVIVKDFSIDLPSDVNYIGCDVTDEGVASGFGNSAGGGASLIENIGGAANLIGGLAGAVGKVRTAAAFGTLGAAAGVVGGITNLKGAAGTANGSAFGSAKKPTYVPVKSTLSVTVLPVYSREDVRKFNLGDFVNGKLLSTGNNIGYN